MEKLRLTKPRLLLGGTAAVALAAVVTLAFFYPVGQVSSLAALNSANYKTYQHDLATPCSSIEKVSNSTSVHYLDEGACAKANVVIGTQDVQANATLIREGFYASCLTNCINGITYSEDPSAYVTNLGRNIMFDCNDFQVSAASPSYSCPSTKDAVTTMTLSAGTADGTDATAATCGNAAIQNTNGVVPVAVTPSAATPISGTATETLTNTWTETAATTSAALSAQCIETTTGTYPVYEFVIGPFTLQGSNTLAITDTVQVS
jgi:hypothetical protein